MGAKGSSEFSKENWENFEVSDIFITLNIFNYI